MKFHLGKRIQNNNNNWQELDEKFQITKPSVLVFGGNTTHDNIEANGYAKVVESLTPNINYSKDVDLLSFYYDHNIIENEHGILTKEAEDSTDKLFALYFLPLIYDENGNPKSEKKIEKAFQQLTFVAHCAGGNVVNGIIKRFHDVLHEFLKPGTADNLIKKIQVVEYSPNQPLDYEVNILYITPTNDSFNSWVEIISSIKQISNQEYPVKVTQKFRKCSLSKLPGIVLSQILQTYNLIAIKSKSTVVAIPGVINPGVMGDHSPKNIVNRSNLSRADKIGYTATAIHDATSQAMQLFIENSIKVTTNTQKGVDMRQVFSYFKTSAEKARKKTIDSADAKNKKTLSSEYPSNLSQPEL